MWRTTYTVTKPANIKQSVAIIDRVDKREMPQTPCPLVQPAPKRVPMPTSNPETTNKVLLALI